MRIPRLILNDTVVNALIDHAKKTPYTHLLHPDGSMYMGRYWLKAYTEDREARAYRLHNICTPDLDPHLHDHPWPFTSIILRGGYIEERPVQMSPPQFEFDREETYRLVHGVGSVIRRRATDRHRIVKVFPDTWTLFITGPQLHWWGFYTPLGKIYWRHYNSVHSAQARIET